MLLELKALVKLLVLKLVSLCVAVVVVVVGVAASRVSNSSTIFTLSKTKLVMIGTGWY